MHIIDCFSDDDLIDYIIEQIDLQNEIKYNQMWDEHSQYNPNYNDFDYSVFK